MTRKTVLMVVALMGVSGFALGWLAFGTHARTAPKRDTDRATNGSAKPAPLLLGLAETKHEFRLLPADRQADRETPALATDAEGRVVAAWSSQTGPDERTIYLTRSTDGGLTFAPPVAWRTVPISRFMASGKPMSGLTDVLPRLDAGDGALALGWAEPRDGDGDGDDDGDPEVVFFSARSTDGGLSFSDPVPVRGPEAQRPDRTALTVAAGGRLYRVWDEANGPSAPAPTEHGAPAAGSGRAIMFSILNADGSVLSTPQAVAPQPGAFQLNPALAVGPDGSIYVAWNELDADGKRVVVTRLRANRPEPAR